MWIWSKGPPMPIVRRRPPPKTAWSAQKVADRRTLGRLVPGNDDKRWPIGKVLANTFRKDEGEKILRTQKALKWKLAPLTSKPASMMHQKIMSLWGQIDISAFPFCIFNVIRCPKYTWLPKLRVYPKYRALPVISGYLSGERYPGFLIEWIFYWIESSQIKNFE